MAATLGARPVIQAEIAQTYIWDTNTLTWIPALQAATTGGGGGGGAVTVADGANVVEGATTDVAVTSDVNGTLSAKLRGLVKILASVWDAVHGRLIVDGSQVTQPVSGTVTANIGTGNLAGITGTVTTTVSNFPSTQPVSAASLPLPTGASTSAKQPALGTAGVPSADVLSIQGVTSMTPVKVDGSGVTQPVSGTVAVSGTVPVSGTFWQTTQPVSGTVTANVGTTNGLALDATLTGGTQQSKITDGTHIANVKAASTAAVATDPALVVAVSPNNSVAVTGTFWQATQPVSIASMPTTPVSGTITAEIVGNAGGHLDAATGSAVPANALFNGAIATTSNPTSAASGNIVGMMADKAGRLVITPSHARDLVQTQTTTVSATTTETTIVTAGAAGIFNDITAIIITSSGTATANWAIRDSTGGTVRATFDTPATAGSAPIIIPCTVPIPQTTAANNWTIKASTSTGTGVHVFVQYIQNK